MIKILQGMFIFTALCLSAPPAAYADTSYALSCPGSVIKGVLPYSVIGEYRSIFKKCSGEVVYDPLHKQVKSVVISIATASIESNCKWCDDIARSKQGLDAAAYPVITFKSKYFYNKKDASWVSGTFDLHGITKNLRSRFDVEEKDDALFLKGIWKLRRKDFNIVWNKLLDHGGILVGNYIMVDWQVKARKI